MASYDGLRYPAAWFAKAYGKLHGTFLRRLWYLCHSVQQFQQEKQSWTACWSACGVADWFQWRFQKEWESNIIRWFHGTIWHWHLFCQNNFQSWLRYYAVSEFCWLKANVNPLDIGWLWHCYLNFGFWCNICSTLSAQGSQRHWTLVHAGGFTQSGDPLLVALPCGCLDRHSFLVKALKVWYEGSRENSRAS